MPDVKPSPRAGAMRLSLMRADQKATGSASVFAIVASILVLALPCLEKPTNEIVASQVGARRYHGNLRWIAGLCEEFRQSLTPENCLGLKVGRRPMSEKCPAGDVIQ